MVLHGPIRILIIGLKLKRIGTKEEDMAETNIHNDNNVEVERYCFNCNKALNKYEKFCTECGYQVIDSLSTSISQKIVNKSKQKFSRMIMVVSSIIVLLIIGTVVFLMILSNNAVENLKNGNFDVAISQYKILAKIYNSNYIREQLAIAEYEKEAVVIINDFFDQLQRVKQDLNFCYNNYQIMELTKSVSDVFNRFHNLDTEFNSDIAVYVKKVKDNPFYQLYQKDYLTGKAVSTESIGLLDVFLGKVTKQLVSTIIDEICKIERPQICLHQLEELQ